jgi:hypothetical protein
MSTDPTTPTNRPDDFRPLADDREIQAALQPRRTLNLPAATAVLAGIVVLAVGLAGGAGLHAAFASGSSGADQAGGSRGSGGFRGRGQAPGQGSGQARDGGAGGGQATVGTVVSANKSQLVVKTQSGDVTVKLTGDTAIEITGKGTVSDLESGQQVIVSGTSTDGTLTARTVRQGDLPTGFNRRGGATPPAR